MPFEKDPGAAPQREVEPALRDPEHLVGRTIGGKYRVLEVLARGGMGRIYRAEQVPLGRPVALKVLHSELDEMGGDSGFQKRFLLEAATCAQLRHPNIVVVYDYGRLEESRREAYFMAMELIEGRTLHQAMRDEARIEVARALRILREVARALREAHRQEMVHRDLKPSNVMLVPTGEGEQVKVLDFGLVKVMRDDSEELTKEGHFLGSPKYMAPEQIRRGPVDGRADLYALGVLGYQMIAGVVPFEGEQPVQTLMAHLHDPVPPLPADLGVPHVVQALLMRCLEKDPAARFSSADELIRTIDELAPAVPGWASLAGASITTSGEIATITSSSFSLSMPRAQPPVSTVAPPAPRSRAVARLAIVAAAAVLAGTLAVFAGHDDAPEPAAAALGAAPSLPSEPAPSEPAPSEPAPSEPTAALPGPAPFTLFVASTPPGATLYRGETAVGTTPTYVQLDPAALEAAPETFRVELTGHAPYVWTQGPAADDVRVDAPLAALSSTEPRPARRRAPRARGDAPEDLAIKTRR